MLILHIVFVQCFAFHLNFMTYSASFEQYNWLFYYSILTWVESSVSSIRVVYHNFVYMWVDLSEHFCDASGTKVLR